MVGLPRGKVRLSPYSKEWSIFFKEEKEELIKYLGEFILDIQHVGSTSIEGLDSKPIIDIAVGVISLEVGYKCIEPLERLGYEYKGHAGVSGRIFFAKGDVINRTHHIHIEEVGSTNWWNHILFRDYLRLHEYVRDEYSELKKILAKEYSDDREKYTAKKVDFILEIVERAKKQFHIK